MGARIMCNLFSLCILIIKTILISTCGRPKGSWLTSTMTQQEPRTEGRATCNKIYYHMLALYLWIVFLLLWESWTKNMQVDINIQNINHLKPKV